MRLFPEHVAAVVMPNHFHILLPEEAKSENIPQKMGAFIATISKQKRLEKLWQKIPAPALIPDHYHLRRQVRYLALNPCRKGLCADPLEWLWSSYREAMGAAVVSKDFGGRLAQSLRLSHAGFRVRFHSYVSGDPSVKVAGTPPPIPASPHVWAEHSITEVLRASAAALRLHPSEVRHRGPLRILFVHMAKRHGWGRIKLLAEFCKITSCAVIKILHYSSPEGIDAADLCLGDVRLTSALKESFDLLN
ncbi:MAG: hypothetical protein A2583_10580 [Bdellovibrionales bacterium RIFOXYD1_FULL_53_11]|nr:MAG: hypothetical protein A2583_10580 [Bdellovibrionales bacterium RIFOXYD1_FULL_53_11]